MHPALRPVYYYYGCCCTFCVFFLLLVNPVFPARFIPNEEDPIQIPIPSPDKNPWANFSKFLDVEKGTSLPGISLLKRYFFRFGYLTLPSHHRHNSSSSSSYNFTDTFDFQLQSALMLYQTNLGLPITGNLDSTTLSHLASPRCGVPDSIHNYPSPSFSTPTRRYAYFYGKPRWVRQTPMTLTYAFSPAHTITYLSPSDIRSVFHRAFARWSAVIPVTFTETPDYDAADVRIGFYSGDHGDGEPFDGVLGVLAHAFSPESGRFHLDSAETWAVDFEWQRSDVAVDLESVATHEIGHVLGLAHSKVKESIMYPNLSPRTKRVELQVDDVKGVQALYGSNPNFNVTLLEAETSSSATVVAARYQAVVSLGVFIVSAIFL